MSAKPMTSLQLEKLVMRLWAKYATSDKHGYKDFMHRDAFNDAVTDAVRTAEKKVAP